jgi:hypothetical protein
MVVRAALGLLIAFAGIARAQAPGQTVSSPSTPTTPATTSDDAVMARRWAVEVALGAASLKPKGANDGTGFGMLGLAARLRLRPTMELALGIAAAGATRDDVQLGAGALYVEFRYRFMADQAWNVFALGGLGVASVAAKSSSDDERKGRGMLRLGGGVERRFGAFAMDASLRLVAIAEHEDLVAPDMPDLGFAFARNGVAGLALALDASYYF